MIEIMVESESESEVTQSCLTLQDPVDCSPPGSSVHGIFQARELEWGAIAFSGRSRRHTVILYFGCDKNRTGFSDEIPLDGGRTGWGTGKPRGMLWAWP